MEDPSGDEDKPIAYAMSSGIEKALKAKNMAEEEAVIYAYKMARYKDFRLTEILNTIDPCINIATDAKITKEDKWNTTK